MWHTKNHNRSDKPVVDALQDVNKGLCDNCLIIRVGKSSDDAITPARRLCKFGLAISDEGSCERCAKWRTLTRLVRPTEKAEFCEPDIATAQISELNELRLELIAYLDRLDPTTKKNEFAKRVGLLQQADRIAPTFAALLLVYEAYRHAMHYRSFEPCEGESAILRQLTAHLGIYLRKVEG